MKLTRLTLQSVRQFRDGLEIPSFEPGLNIFSGPNEAGKSTIAEAIRAAFFERYRSKSRDDLLPKGETVTSASPQIDLAFEYRGQSYHFSKSFFARPRCVLQTPGGELENDEAEAWLAQELGFEYSGRGDSRPDNQGIPGLLWVQQGLAQTIADPLSHASAHMNAALESIVGSVASTQGDQLISHLERLRDELLTARGKPRGDLDKAIKAVEDLEARRARLRTDIEGYRADVDRLAELRAAGRREENERPWERLEQQRLEASRALEAGQQLEERISTRRREIDTQERLLHNGRQVQADHQARLRERAERQHELQEVLDQQQRVQASLDKVLTELRQVEDALGATQKTLEAARVAARRAELGNEIQQLQTQDAQLRATLEQVQQYADALQRAKAQVEANCLDSDLLRSLDDGAERLAKLDTEQRAAATSIRLALRDGVAVELNGQAVSTEGEHLLTTVGRLNLAGVGTIDILPGGKDLGTLERQRAKVESSMAAMLARVGEPTMAAVRARYERLQAALRDQKEAEGLLKALAPQGFEALSVAAGALQERLQRYEAERNSLPESEAGSSATPVADLEAEGARLGASRDALKMHTEKMRAELAGLTGRIDTLNEGLARLTAQVDDAVVLQRIEAARADEVRVQALLDTLRAHLAVDQVEESKQNLDLLKQTVERFARSRDQAHKQYIDRGKDIAALESLVRHGEAGDREERLAELDVTLAAALRQRDQLQARADALQLLVDRLTAGRERVTRKLLAPLQARMDHYVRILLGDAQLELGVDLKPHRLQRAGQTNAIEFDLLSFGAREQLALISRLAYADLLQQADRPALLILDDTLVHADERRLIRMKQVLFDAATRHQVLLFTCHPERWDDMGTAARDVRNLVRSRA